MGYYMRFVVTGGPSVTVNDLKQALQQAGDGYRFEESESGMTVYCREGRIADITLDGSGEGMFEGEREELLEFAEEGRGKGKPRVLAALRAARQIVAVQVLWGSRESETTLSQIDPLWRWLFENCEGLLQADGEGYYEGDRLILQVEQVVCGNREGVNMAELTQDLEGTWEENLEHSEELAGRRVRLRVLRGNSDEPDPEDAEARKKQLLEDYEAARAIELSAEDIAILDEFPEFRRQHPLRFRRLDQ